MKAEARRMLYRIETRVAQACGLELAKRDIASLARMSTGERAASDAWAAGLIRAWKQIRKLRETGNVVSVDDTEAVTI